MSQFAWKLLSKEGFFRRYFLSCFGAPQMMHCLGLLNPH